MFWEFFKSRVFASASEIGIFAPCFLRNIHILVDSSDVLFEVLTDGLEFLAIDTNHCKKIDLLFVLTLLNDKLMIYNLSTAPQVEKRKCDNLDRPLRLGFASVGKKHTPIYRRVLIISICEKSMDFSPSCRIVRPLILSIQWCTPQYRLM